MVDGKSFHLADGVRYIQRRAPEHDNRIVSIGHLVLFSREFGNAWMLDASERLAMPLECDGLPEPIHIENAETTFTVAWTGLDQRSSAPIGIAGRSPPCSATQYRSFLRWGRPTRGRAAMRSNF